MTWEPKNKLDDEDVGVSDDDDKDRDDDKNGKSSNSTPSNILLLVLKCNGFTFSEYCYALNDSDVKTKDSISSSNTSSLFTLNAATRTNVATSIVMVTEENSSSGFGGVKQF